MAKLEDIKFGLKEVVMLVGWILSLAGMYFKMTADVNSLKDKIGNHNLELIEFKLNQANEKADRILLLLDDSK